MFIVFTTKSYKGQYEVVRVNDCETKCRQNKQRNTAIRLQVIASIANTIEHNNAKTTASKQNVITLSTNNRTALIAPSSHLIVSKSLFSFCFVTIIVQIEFFVEKKPFDNLQSYYKKSFRIDFFHSEK
jgi:hypothetical protein